MQDTCFKFSAAVTCKDVARKRQKIEFYFLGGVVVVFFGLFFCTCDDVLTRKHKVLH